MVLKTTIVMTYFLNTGMNYLNTILTSLVKSINKYFEWNFMLTNLNITKNDNKKFLVHRFVFENFYKNYCDGCIF